MADEPSPERTRTPYEAATAEFFALFGDGDLTQGRIQNGVAGLLQIAMPVPNADMATYRQKLIANWTDRGTFGVEAEDGAVMERVKRPEDIEAERVRKINLLCDISGFVLGSEYSVLSNVQKRDIVDRGLLRLKSLEVSTREARIRLGDAIAPYVAVAVEKAGLNDNSEAYVSMGRAALELMDQRDLGTIHSRNNLVRALKHPEQHTGSPRSRLMDMLRKVL